MATMKVKISARNLDPLCNYKPFVDESVEPAFFTDEIPNQEVIPKKLINPAILWKTATFAFASALMIMEPTLANTSMEVETMKTAQELSSIFNMFAKLLAAAGVGCAGVLLSGAGLYRMFKKNKEAMDWSSDIIKGLTQVLIASPTVMLLVYIATLLFGNSSWFVSPLFP